jgi:Ca2+-binding EF-hand superfamily protein
MSITTISSLVGFNPSLMAAKILKDLDTNNDQTINKSEFIAGMKSKGMSQADAEKLFNSIDTKGTGILTQPDIEKAMRKNSASGRMSPPRDMPPEGAHGAPAGKSGKTEESSSLNSSPIYDKKDANKDGTVTIQEAMNYYLSHPVEKLKDDKAQNVYKILSYDQQGTWNSDSSSSWSALNIAA